MRLIVTAGIGSGKSTACAMLAKMLPTYESFSVDDAVRGLYDDTAFQAELTAHFGVSKRSQLSALVFADPLKRRELERLSSRFLSPLIAKAMELPRVIVEFPLLFEVPGWAHRADFTLALGCAPEIQRARVLARDSISSEKFDRIVSAQHSTELRKCLCDAYIDTSGTLSDVEQSVLALLPELKRRELKARCSQFFGTRAIWPLIEAAYSQPHRAYHNLEHLQEVFSALGERNSPVKGTLTPHSRAIELAVWFHDFVYNTQPPAYALNESLSAKAMFQTLTEHLPHWLEGNLGQEVFLAVEFILATRKHSLDTPYLDADPSRRAAAARFLDADLAVLAAPASRFARYDADIATEWGQKASALSPEFRQGRANALSRFLERSAIFLSDYSTQRESLARQNLQRKLEELRTS